MDSGDARRSREDRKARVAQLQADQARADRRRRRMLVLVVTLIVLALAVPTVLLVLDGQRDRTAVAQVAADPIEGEVTRRVPTPADHVDGPVPAEDLVVEESDEGVLPPMGGDHDPVVQNCGFYGEPVQDEHVVHSLEHGAVWVTYRPDLEQAQVDRLRELTGANPYLLVSPYPDLASPVVATAWGVQLQLESVTDERLLPFLERYLEGEQTPEPGAACSGGVGG